MDLTCTNPNYIMLKKGDKKVTFISREHFLGREQNPIFNYYQTRCNKCLSCRLYKGYQWSNRLLAESLKWNRVYFLTLTFSEKNYDITKLMSDPARQTQLFMKRLRKKYPKQTFKYFATSELGGETLRFHYHMILYSQEHIFPDMTYWNNPNRPGLYNSTILRDLWKNGDIKIAWATQDTMRYTANYVQDSKNSVKHTFSRGLGIEYMLQNDVEKDGIYIISGHFAPIPRSVKNKYDYPDTVPDNQQIKIQNIIGLDIDTSNEIRERYINNGHFRKRT